MSLLDQYLLDQQSLDVDMSDIFVSPEKWSGFLQEVLETTVAAYLTLRQNNTVSSSWEEDTFTINMERCMNLLTRRYKSLLHAETQRPIYTPEMMLGKVSPTKAVKLDIKIWDMKWNNEDEIYFTWECKLIVDKAREDKHRRLVPEYITNGIVRFLDGNWKYAQAVTDAGILGYVLYGEVAQIVETINQEMLAIPQSRESSRKKVRAMQALQAARRLSSSDQLKLCNPSPVNNFIFYESCHRRHFCNQDIRLYHFFLTFDFAA
ncbi:MAG TPA: hypothetical protein VFB60_04845 [Ktedonobacteraceae bacterium]|nr:hypothetical protein [Ktedonobacteraceae bacterium]